MSVEKYTNIQQQVFINEDDMFLKLTQKCLKVLTIMREKRQRDVQIETEKKENRER